MSANKCGLIVACDMQTPQEAVAFLDKLDRAAKYVKVGPRLYAMGGAPFVKEIINKGYGLFLDLKLHDIPNSVSSAVEVLSDMGLWALTLHTSGGAEMMSQSVSARDRAKSETKLFGVTVLTSLSGDLWSDAHPGCDISEAIAARAVAAERSGLDGLVCSPLDLGLLSGRAKSLLRIVPGIRAQGSAGDDQKRTAAAEEAKRLGASYIVVGRPIVKAKDPVAAAREFLNVLEEA